MSKLYLKYLKMKNKDKSKYYLFRSGMFYIFLDEDAINISKKVPLKITNLNSEIVKCGFPKNSLDKYMEVFNNLGIEVLVIDDSTNEDVKDKIIKMIKEVDINELSPLKSLELLNKFKELLDE